MVALVVALMGLSATGAAQLQPQTGTQCWKRVFNLYCLGGDIQQLAREQPRFAYQQAQGQHFALIYTEGRDQIYVMAYKGRIYKVLRRHEPATRLRFEELKGLLNDKYGSARDESLYPAYARLPSSRTGAILRGEGKALLVWRPDPAWRVELSWTREGGLSLAYLANDLDAEQNKALQGGY